VKALTGSGRFQAYCARTRRTSHPLHRNEHGESFREAATISTILFSGLPLIRITRFMSTRYLTNGSSAEGRLLVVAHADAIDDDRIRIINARRVTSAERRTYEEG
jgi:uncharacterized DUF497 family protein